jgi:hypothetical protein
LRSFKYCSYFGGKSTDERKNHLFAMHRDTDMIDENKNYGKPMQA